MGGAKKESGQALARLPAVLLPWYDENRRVLPWREEVTPYRTWVSEVMLQQTRVQAALPYFLRFMEAAPDIPALAALPEEQLMRLWQGLGYYSRARSLQKAARQVVEQYGGCLPQTYSELTALPGIGDYTAGAILSIAFGQPVPAVDGNVLRIAARLTGCGDNVLLPQTRSRFRDALAAVMPPHRPGDFNQALMDLGAGVCLPGQPACEACPARMLCAALAAGRQRELPVREKNTAKPTEQLTVFVLTRPDGAAALRQRPEKGLLAGSAGNGMAAVYPRRPPVHPPALGHDRLGAGGGGRWSGGLAVGGRGGTGGKGHPLGVPGVREGAGVRGWGGQSRPPLQRDVGDGVPGISHPRNCFLRRNKFARFGQKTPPECVEKAHSGGSLFPGAMVQ